MVKEILRRKVYFSFLASTDFFFKIFTRMYYCSFERIEKFKGGDIDLLVIYSLTGDAEVIGQNKNVNNLFINKKTNYYYIFLK